MLDYYKLTLASVVCNQQHQWFIYSAFMMHKLDVGACGCYLNCHEDVATVQCEQMAPACGPRFVFKYAFICLFVEFNLNGNPTGIIKKSKASFHKCKKAICLCFAH